MKEQFKVVFGKNEYIILAKSAKVAAVEICKVVCKKQRQRHKLLVTNLSSQRTTVFNPNDLMFSISIISLSKANSMVGGGNNEENSLTLRKSEKNTEKLIVGMKYKHYVNSKEFQNDIFVKIIPNCQRSTVVNFISEMRIAKIMIPKKRPHFHVVDTIAFGSLELDSSSGNVMIRNEYLTSNTKYSLNISNVQSILNKLFHDVEGKTFMHSNLHTYGNNCYKSCYYVLTEAIKNGITFESYIQNFLTPLQASNTFTSEKQILHDNLDFIFRKMIDQLNYTFTRYGFIHWDLHSQNVLLKLVKQNKPNVKAVLLFDFDQSQTKFSKYDGLPRNNNKGIVSAQFSLIPKEYINNPKIDIRLIGRGLDLFRFLFESFFSSKEDLNILKLYCKRKLELLHPTDTETYLFLSHRLNNLFNEYVDCNNKDGDEVFTFMNLNGYREFYDTSIPNHKYWKMVFTNIK